MRPLRLLLVSAALACGTSSGTPARAPSTTGEAPTTTSNRTTAGRDVGDTAPGSAGEATSSATADATGPSGSTGESRVPSVTGLAAVAANAAVGLEWPRLDGADRYNVYWSTRPGVTPDNGTLLADVQPGILHTDLDNGTPYHYVATAIVNGVEGLPSVEVTATPGGPWRLIHLGTGAIEGIAIPGTLQIPIEDRVHVGVLPEGYLEDELPSFDADAEQWFADVFGIEPYASFDAAFVVWTLERASNEHVTPTSPQQADTAFAVPIRSNGTTIDEIPLNGPTAERVWAELASFPYPPTRFWPSGGVTNEIAKTLVLHTLVFDPADGESGFSGRSRRVENPAVPGQRVSNAFARNLAHEFTHAFARLDDEYLDVEQSNLGEDPQGADQSAGVSNVIMSAACETLPWAHLFAGSAINPDTDQLIGAFGTDEIGYHAEFKCLMNGRHDNDLFYGGDGDLRSDDRLCNWCRELAAFRLLERVGVLDDPQVSLQTWVEDYRGAFYRRFGFVVPRPTPQQNSEGDAWFQACAP